MYEKLFIPDAESNASMSVRYTDSLWYPCILFILAAASCFGGVYCGDIFMDCEYITGTMIVAPGYTLTEFICLELQILLLILAAFLYSHFTFVVYKHNGISKPWRFLVTFISCAAFLGLGILAKDKYAYSIFNCWWFCPYGDDDSSAKTGWNSAIAVAYISVCAVGCLACLVLSLATLGINESPKINIDSPASTAAPQQLSSTTGGGSNGSSNRSSNLRRAYGIDAAAWAEAMAWTRKNYKRMVPPPAPEAAKASALAEAQALIQGQPLAQPQGPGSKAVDATAGLVNAADVLAAHTTPLEHTPTFLWTVAVVFCLFYPLCLLLSMTVMDLWEDMTAADQNEYIAEVLPQTYGTVWNWRWSAQVVLKLYPDIAIYYAYLFAVVLVGLGSCFSPTWRDVLHSRIVLALPLPGRGNSSSVSSSGVNSSGVRFTVGGLVFAFWTGAMFLLEGLYWFLDHVYEDDTATTLTAAELLARTMGQLGSITLGLLFLPIARNNAFSLVLGIPWDQMVATHRRLGNLFMVILAIHAGSWWCTFAQQGTFPHDILAVPTHYHPDNFTIPLAECLALVLVVSHVILNREYFRRKFFEWFYTAHVYVSVVVVAVVLVHANMSWYYVLPPVALYVYDVCGRFLRQCARVQVLDLVYHPPSGTTVIKYRAEHGGVGPGLSRCPFAFSSLSSSSSSSSSVSCPVGVSASLPPSATPVHSNENNSTTIAPVSSSSIGGIIGNSGSAGSSSAYCTLRHRLGQYVFLNIPSVSRTEWHPFTISSTPFDDVTTHHIKAMEFSDSGSSNSNHSRNKSVLSDGSSRVGGGKATGTFATYSTRQAGVSDTSKFVQWTGKLANLAREVGERKQEIFKENYLEVHGSDGRDGSDPESEAGMAAEAGGDANGGRNGNSGNNPHVDVLSAAKLTERSAFSLVSALSSAVRCNVDGPYGLGFDHSRYRAVLLVGGGIGITPCMAIYRGLNAMYRHGCLRSSGSGSRRGRGSGGSGSGGSGSSLPYGGVHLLWAARDFSLFELFADELGSIVPQIENEQGSNKYANYYGKKDRSDDAGGVPSGSGGFTKLPRDEEGSGAGAADGEVEEGRTITRGVFCHTLHMTKPLFSKRAGAEEAEKEKEKVEQAGLRARALQLAAKVNAVKGSPGATTGAVSGVPAAAAGSPAAVAGGELSLRGGRPDVSRRVRSFLGETGCSPGEVLVFVCGPAGLVEAARNAADEHGTHFHTETFLL